MPDDNLEYIKLSFSKEMTPQDMWHGIEVYLFCAEIFGETPKVIQGFDEELNPFIYLQMTKEQFKKIDEFQDLIKERASMSEVEFTAADARKIMKG